VISHHTAKFVAREKVVDNHAGRGGSALGDNTRSALVMTKLDKSYKGIRQPKATPDEIAEGRIIEMAHARNSFGPLIEPRYFRAVSGEGHHPIMEEIESVRRGSLEEQEWKTAHKEELGDVTQTLILEYIREMDETGGDPISSGWIDNVDRRKEHLRGVSRNVAREAMKELLGKGKVIKVDNGNGKATNYILPTSQYDVPAPSVTATPEVDRDAPYIDANGHLVDPVAERNAAPY